MADPYFDAIRQGGQAYADTQLKADPYYALAQGFQAAPAQANFTNPWANVGIALAAPLVGGMTAGKAQQNYQQNLNQGLSALTNFAAFGSPVPAGMETYAQNVNLGKAQMMAEEAQKDAAVRRQFQQNMMVEAAKWEANDPGRRMGLPTVNPFGQYFQQPTLAGGPNSGAFQMPQSNQGPAQMVPTQAPVTTDPGAVVQVQGAMPVTIPEQTPQTKAAPKSYRQALIENSGDPEGAKYSLELSKEAMKEDKARVEEAEKKLSDLRTNQQLSATNLQELASAYERAGETGGSFNLTQDLRKVGLKTGIIGGDKAQDRLGGMQDLKSLALAQAALIRKDFPGPVSEKEMAMYVGSGANEYNAPAENKAVIERLSRLQAAGIEARRFIEQRVDQGKTYDQAEREYIEYDARVPLFIQKPGGKREINPARLSQQQGGGIPAQVTPQSAPIAQPFRYKANTGEEVEIID